jgi:DNA (cytosine-5)-methyltransferase 1
VEKLKVNAVGLSRTLSHHASFFSGIGGFDLGFDRAGFVTSSQSEIDPFCCSVLKRHWPAVTRFGSIAEIRPEDVPTATVWTAGFPCQDVSLARGNHQRPGFKGQNSSLFFEFFRLVKRRKPSVVVLENVTGLLSSNSGNDFSLVLASLAKAGYGVAWRVLNTRYFGAPQSRQRVFVCAVLGSARTACKIIFDEMPEEIEDPRAAFREVHYCDKTGAYVPRISFCVAATSGRHTGNDWSRTYVAYERRVRRPTPGETEALQGFPSRWTMPGDEYAGRGSDSYDSERYRSLGNAVSVPVAHWLAKRVRVEVSRQPHTRNNQISQAMAEKWQGLGRVRQRNLSATCAGKWSSAGFVCDNKSALDFSGQDRPRVEVRSKFVDILSQDEDLDSYFITPNAAQGMLRRASTLNRRFFEPLDRALRYLARARS